MLLKPTWPNRATQRLGPKTQRVDSTGKNIISYNKIKALNDSTAKYPQGPLPPSIWATRPQKSNLKHCTADLTSEKILDLPRAANSGTDFPNSEFGVAQINSWKDELPRVPF